MIRLALLLAFVATPASPACRLALALGIDVSRSVDARDYAIQREGLLAALADRVIVDAFLKPEDRVALAVFEWSGQAQQDIVLDWTEVAGEADLARIRDRIAGHRRVADHLPTGLGAALDFGRLCSTARPTVSPARSTSRATGARTTGASRKRSTPRRISARRW
ncbi:MAG: DUF1194 domain-containing protein [Albidovulum sp.]